ncbi:hypothetical protein N7445_007705 [Penicillium cf. griseofulvum]|nr:hypothetical protein N7445_007705 [Penicillium cf. griseofulvum]
MVVECNKRDPSTSHLTVLLGKLGQITSLGTNCQIYLVVVLKTLAVLFLGFGGNLNAESDSEKSAVERIGQEYEEWCANDVFYQGWNDPDYWYQHSEWNVPNVDEDAMSRSVSKTSVRFEGDTSGRGSSTDQLPRDKLPEKKAPKKRKRSSAAKYTSVECKPCHKKTEKSGKEPEERNKKQRRKRQKKSESNQAEVQESPRANKMEANKRKFEEQESRRDPKKRSLETRNIRNRDCSRRSLRKQAGEVLRIYQIRSGRPTMKVKSSRLQ